jgi:dihydrofolate reductase
MGKIVISENVTLDGVIQDPAGEEGFARGGWFGQIKDHPGVARLALDDAVGAEALVFGRRTYEFFAARWPSRNGELADRLNTMPKYVVSSTLEDPEWNNTTVLSGDAGEEVGRLRRELEGEILVLGSCQLVRALTEHSLVDELRLKVFPVVAGAGERLFGATADAIALRLLDAQVVDDGVAVLTHARVMDGSDGGRGGERLAAAQL